MISWLNSIQAHLILLALGVVAALTACSVVVISFTAPPSRSPVSVYEMSRIVRGLPIVEPPEKVVVRGRAAEAADPQGEAEVVISRLLARELNRRPQDVRVRLEGDRRRGGIIGREAALYSDEQAADPVLYYGFTISVRASDGSWTTFTRPVSDTLAQTLQFWRYGTFYLGILVVLPLAMLFSLGISRPIRAFAASADRIGAGLDDAPVPVRGPTEIRQAAVALNEMQARIADFVRERTALVGAIAHDLRTPLGSLRFRIASLGSAALVEAEPEILRMEQIVSSTLDYVDSEGGRMTVEPIDLGSLLQTLVNECRDREANVFLVSEEPLTVDGDLVLLRRIFANLIENGLKFGSSVWVRCWREGGNAAIDIVDDGPGMADEDIPLAFAPFFRGERSRSRSTGGIGLGLAIVQAAANAHGGKVSLRNLDGGFGARVIVPLTGVAVTSEWDAAASDVDVGTWPRRTRTGSGHVSGSER